MPGPFPFSTQESAYYLPALDLDALVDRQVTSIVAAMRKGGHDVPGQTPSASCVMPQR